METIKNLIGAGESKKEEQSGQEPVSGVQGTGVGGEPFDAGNEVDTSVSGKTGQEPVSGVQGAGTAEKPFDAGNSDDKADLAGKAPQRTDDEEITTSNSAEAGKPTESTSAETPIDTATPKLEKKPTIGSSKWFTESKTEPEQTTKSTNTALPAEPEAPKLEKQPTIGSSRWFTNANPFAAKSSSSSQGAAEATPEPKSAPTAQDSTRSGSLNTVKRDTPSSLPPNHLGENVPPGQDSIVVEPTAAPSSNMYRDDITPGQANGFIGDKGKGKARMSPEQVEQFESRQDFPSHKTESSSTDTRRESVSTQYTIGTRQTYSTAGTGASIAGSSRRASAAVHIVHSQGKPIMAGGVPLGLPAMEERERRLSFSVPEDPEHDLTHTSPTKNTTEGLKHHDAGSAPTRPATVQAKNTGRDTVAEPEAGDDKLRRKSSIIHKAKDFGKRWRSSKSK